MVTNHFDKNIKAYRKRKAFPQVASTISKSTYLNGFVHFIKLD